MEDKDKGQENSEAVCVTDFASHLGWFRYLLLIAGMDVERRHAEVL